MGIDLHLSTCVDTQSPKYLEMAQGHISLSLAYAYAAGMVHDHQGGSPVEPEDLPSCPTVNFDDHPYV
jgi:hypothetical protein